MKPSPKKKAALVETRINQEAIGARLRELFDEVVSEPVPDEFLDILRGAEERAPPSGADADAGK